MQTDSRFFIIEEGAVECRKTFQVIVDPPKFLPVAFASSVVQQYPSLFQR